MGAFVFSFLGKMTFVCDTDAIFEGLRAQPNGIDFEKARRLLMRPM